MTSTTRTRDEIEAWLIHRVGEYETGGDDPVTTDTPLGELGFSSVYALTLCGDIEDHYELEVDPTLLWDQNTIGDLAGTIESLLAAPSR